MSLTRDNVLDRIRNKLTLVREELAQIDLSHAFLEEVVFDRSDLSGANLESVNGKRVCFRNADLREAHLVNADLCGANFEGADLEGAKLAGAKLVGANFSRASLVGADLEGADLSEARLVFAELADANLARAKLSSAILEHADLANAYLGGAIASQADFTSATLSNTCLEEATLTGAILVKANLCGAMLKNADLSDADARFAILTGANLDGAQLTGAHVVGLVGTGAPLGTVKAQWLDISADGDGSERVTNGVIPSLLSGRAKVDLAALEPTATANATANAAANAAEAPTTSSDRRYLGVGDTIRGAEFEFPANTLIEIDSILQDCTIHLATGAELIVGPRGLLVDCKVSGPGKVRIQGKFYQRESPGIIEPSELRIGASASVIADVVQGEHTTKFSFERGCGLKMKISRNQEKR